MTSMELFFLRTCQACPEQYEVYTKNGEQVGYVRLRWGSLTAYHPDYGTELIYQYDFNDGFKGCFDSEGERDKHLTNILNKLKHKLYADGIDCSFIVTDNPDDIK